MTTNPILVTGAHRTGTTWVGRMLATDAKTAYVREPLSAIHRPGVFDAEVKYWYTLIDDHNEDQYLPAFRKLLQFDYNYRRELTALRSVRDLLRMVRDAGAFFIARLRQQRPLIKDPFAVFSAPWFARKLGCALVITIRHPAAFAHSLKRLNWPFDFHDLLAQPRLLELLSESDRAEMESMKAEDVIGQGALLWRIIYQFVHHTRERFAEFSLVRHEDVSLDPVGEFQKLYSALGLNFDERARKSILNSSSSENPAQLSKRKTHSVKLDSRENLRSWKRNLAPHEIDRIRRMTQPVADLYYSTNDW